MKTGGHLQVDPSIVCVTDAKSAFDHLVRESTGNLCRRTAQELCVIRRSMQTLRARCTWVPHERDGLRRFDEEAWGSTTILLFLSKILRREIHSWSRSPRVGRNHSCFTCSSSCPFVSHFSSDEHRRSHSCLGTGMRAGTQNTFVVIVHLWTIASATVFRLCLFASATFLVRLLEKRSLYPCTDYLANDSETEDPRGWPMGKSRRGHSSGTTVWTGSTSKLLSANSGVHLPLMEARLSTVSGDIIVAREPAGWMAFETV